MTNHQFLAETPRCILHLGQCSSQILIHVGGLGLVRVRIRSIRVTLLAKAAQGLAVERG
jgi:hypothetical protein